MAFIGGQGSRRRVRSEARPIPHFSDPFEGDNWPKLNPYDPLNITERVSQHLYKSNRGAIRSVHDLGAIIASCCVDIFDSRQAPEDYQFFDFFERSINKAVSGHISISVHIC
jgi:hypothetical protein